MVHLMKSEKVRRPISAPWRPLFWEPVTGTGEKIAIGVLYKYADQWATYRFIRDDVLDSLYGKSASGAKSLLDHALEIYRVAAAAIDDINLIEFSVCGVLPGPARHVEINSIPELLQVAALLYSSLAQIDEFDDQEETDTPQSEEVNKRFSTELREAVVKLRPELIEYFNKGGRLTTEGQIVKFGYFSPSLILHFSVLHPVRQPASVRDACAKLWEISHAAEIANIRHAGLITAVPRTDDPSIGSRQKQAISQNQREIESEAASADLKFYPVHNAEDGARQLISLAFS